MSSRFRALACSASTEPAERRRTRPGGPSRYVLSWQAAGVLEHVACIATSSLPNPTCPSSRRHHELRRLWPRARTRKPSSVVRREALSAELKRGFGCQSGFFILVFLTPASYTERAMLSRSLVLTSLPPPSDRRFPWVLGWEDGEWEHTRPSDPLSADTPRPLSHEPLPEMLPPAQSCQLPLHTHLCACAPRPCVCP